jgi:hypothetical protein
MKPQAAVLTGDLVGSTRAPPEAINTAIGRIEQIAGKLDDVASFTRFRGDGWQLYLGKPGLALATALLISATLRASEDLETRMSIGLGGAYFSSFTNILAVRDLSVANGEAFIASGRGLDQMEKKRRLTLSGEGVDLLHQRLIAIVDERVARWSIEQAEVAAILLSPGHWHTQATVAEQLGISRQAVAARMKAADYHQINAAATDFLHHYGTEEIDDA